MFDAMPKASRVRMDKRRHRLAIVIDPLHAYCRKNMLTGFARDPATSEWVMGA